MTGRHRHGTADLAARADLADGRAGRAPGWRGGGRPAAAAAARSWLSSFASKPVEEVVAANPQTFFQMYWCGTVIS